MVWKIVLTSPRKQRVVKMFIIGVYFDYALTSARFQLSFLYMYHYNCNYWTLCVFTVEKTFDTVLLLWWPPRTISAKIRSKSDGKQASYERSTFFCSPGWGMSNFLIIAQPNYAPGPHEPSPEILTRSNSAKVVLSSINYPDFVYVCSRTPGQEFSKFPFNAQPNFVPGPQEPSLNFEPDWTVGSSCDVVFCNRILPSFALLANISAFPLLSLS